MISGRISAISDIRSHDSNESSEDITGLLVHCSRIICLVFALLGLLQQSYEISENYFSYETTTLLNINKTSFLDMPALLVCFWSSDYSGRTQVSGSDILRDIPAIEDIMIGCQIRQKGSYMMTSHKSVSKCLKSIKVIKFTRYHFKCYRFSVNDYRLHSYRHSDQSVMAKGLFYEIKLNKTYFEEVDYFDIEHTRNVWPPLSYSVPMTLDTDLYSGKMKTKFLSTFSSFNVQSLPAPYTTDCIDYDMLGKFSSKYDCIEKCKVEKSVAILDRVPFSAIIAESAAEYLNRTILSNRDFANLTLARIFNGIQESCRHAPQCRFSNCYDEIQVTHALSHKRTNDIEFNVHAPREPFFEIWILPRLDIIDYVIYLCSCISIWLGFSALDLRKLVLKILSRFSG
ncbi:hypothetical protein HDE_12848 [Halotydeus destructor]|nr:hypothetical protein HDE_12848 [Halotydeus destructor]